MDPKYIFTIPNAINCDKFTPDPNQVDKSKINIVYVGRLEHNKGVDLLLDTIPPLCEKYQNLFFHIAGDGSMRILIEDMIEKYNLKNCTKLYGLVPNDQVRNILVKGQIFLNPTLTEAFCIANLEAASCGLLVVSNDVGGVKEVLPPDMIFLSEPNPESILQKMDQAIKQANQYPKSENHERIRKIYSWKNVAERTIKAYDLATEIQPRSLKEIVSKFYLN